MVRLGSSTAHLADGWKQFECRMDAAAIVHHQLVVAQRIHPPVFTGISFRQGSNKLDCF